MDYLTSTIKNQDIYGYQIHLNFGQHNRLYRSFIGGIFTLILKLTILSMVVAKTIMLFSSDANRITQFKTEADISEGIRYT